YLFFFSSRRRHTRCYRDWSSDVCSSDLSGLGPKAEIESDPLPSGDANRHKVEYAAGPGSLEQRPWAEREKVMSICSSSGASSPWCGSQDTLDGFSKAFHQRQRTFAQPALLSRAPGFPCSQLHLRNRLRLRLQCRSPLLVRGEP